MCSAALQILAPTTVHASAWQLITSLVLDGIASPHTRRAYAQALEEFFIWFADDPRREFNKAAVQKYRSELDIKGLAPSSINVRLCAIRRFAVEAGDNGLLAPEIAAGISRARGAKRIGSRLGRWLTAEQVVQLLEEPDPDTLKGLRDHAILAVLLGAGLRRSELTALNVDHFQQREGRWLIVDLIGKQGRVRSVPIPAWAQASVARWQAAASITTGAVYRRVSRHGSVMPSRLSPQAVFQCLKFYADKLNISVSPHDLRRSFAKLAYSGHAPLEQIQLSLGHASLVTTEIYLGTRQTLNDAPCDHLGLHWNRHSRGE
jgi:site-specific recombinase XerD